MKEAVDNTSPKCSICGTELVIHQGRGRPAKKCPSCRVLSSQRPITVKEKLTSTEIVDNLETMLRSRGTHIAQNRKD